MVETAAGFARAVMLALVTLLPLINPAGTVPIFLSMTPGVSESLRAHLARRVAWNSCGLLIVAMLAGSYVLLLFGLSMTAVKIAGGLLVTATAWYLLRSEPSPDSELAASSRALPPDQAAAHSFYPLTFPITIGPGSISVAMSLGAGVRGDAWSDLARLGGGALGIVIVSAVIYLCYRNASRLQRALGPTGSVVLVRLSAFLLLCVGVQILFDGIAERLEMIVSGIGE